MRQAYRGIDYSGPGATCNRNAVTGIRYGIIPLNALAEWAFDEFESEYDATCPHCGIELEPMIEAPTLCPTCDGEIRHNEDMYGDEPSRWVLNKDGYRGFLDSSNDVWVIESPYVTRAAFCSPCAPGACYLASPCEDGEKAYCLGSDWFENNKAPYSIAAAQEDSDNG